MQHTQAYKNTLFAPPEICADKIQLAKSISASLALFLLQETPIRGVVECLLGRQVLWEWIRARPVPKPLFDQPQFWCENVHVTNQSGVYPQPTLVFTIGAPGSGKTSWAKYTFGNYAVVAADDWFTLTKSDFHPSLLGKAHGWCKQQVLRRLREGVSVVVNNTNTTPSEMFDYVAAVLYGGYPHRIVFARMPETRVGVLAKRGLHGVPERQIKNMIRRISSMGSPSVKSVLRAGPMRQRELASTKVLYVGLFFDEKTSNMVKNTFLSNSRAGNLLERVMNFHVTIQFLPDRKYVEKIGIGSQHDIEITGYYSHPTVQVLTCTIPPALQAKSCNENSHITISTQTVAASVANHALKHAKIIPISKITIKSTLCAFMSGGKIVSDFSGLPRGWEQGSDRRGRGRGRGGRGNSGNRGGRRGGIGNRKGKANHGFRDPATPTKARHDGHSDPGRGRVSDRGRGRARYGPRGERRGSRGKRVRR
ncbi:hypothetical protein AAMO2058_000641300 [Amorphochlora amoebiformis]